MTASTPPVSRRVFLCGRWRAVAAARWWRPAGRRKRAGLGGGGGGSREARGDGVGGRPERHTAAVDTLCNPAHSSGGGGGGGPWWNESAALPALPASQPAGGGGGGGGAEWWEGKGCRAPAVSARHKRRPNGVRCRPIRGDSCGPAGALDSGGAALSHADGRIRHGLAPASPSVASS